MPSLIHFTLCFTWIFVFVASGSTQTCNRGFWGERCENKCSKRCRCDLGCDKLTGKCSYCDYGYWGFYCTERCPSTCQNYCSTYPRRVGFDCIYALDCGTQCNINSGKCSSCPYGVWGEYCNKHCVQVDRCLRCQISNGSNCYECNPGFWGTSCENKCLQNCEKCSKYSGSCSSSYCNRGYYGANCANQCYIHHCEKCYNSSYCQECEYGYWGPSCTSCNVVRCDSCNHISGKCQKCKNGFWGDTCEFECTRHCAEAYCDKLTGMCFTCKNNFWGDFCNNTCILGHCSSFGECSKEDGPVCYQCDPERWGNHCEYECSTNCTDGCKKSSGECYVIEHEVESSPKTTVRETPSNEITSTEHNSGTEYKVNSEMSELTIIGISVGTSLSVAIVFIVLAVLLFIFCYTRIKAKLERKLVSQEHCIHYSTGEQKATLKGFDNAIGLKAENNLYEIPVRSSVTTGNTLASDNDFSQEQLYTNCRINAV